MSPRYSLNQFFLSVAPRPDQSIVLGTTMNGPGQTPEEYDAVFIE